MRPSVLKSIDPVSIAEAILWGEQRNYVPRNGCAGNGFNRRGDSLGGATFAASSALSVFSLMFQSQRRFFGGSNIYAAEHVVSIAEAILWGSNVILIQFSFNRRGDSLGGATIKHVARATISASVSIAEAILWGEQLYLRGRQWGLLLSFNRRGDSLGGATVRKGSRRYWIVSIAEAILWGEQPPPGPGRLPINDVSIAEAILWGEQRCFVQVHQPHHCFNRRGDSLGGATEAKSSWHNEMFQSQRRFFGGSNAYEIRKRLHCFNRRGDSLGGATLD